MLFRLSAEALIEAARSPKHLGAEIGFFGVLQSWTQRMEHYPHVHCVVPAGGLSFDHQRRVPVNPRYRFFLPKKVLAKLFRGKLRAALEDAFAKGRIGFHGQLQHLSDPKVFHCFIRELFEMVGGYSLGGILHSQKSYTAKSANRILVRSGQFWGEDYYDRYIRDDHLRITIE